MSGSVDIGPGTICEYVCEGHRLPKGSVRRCVGFDTDPVDPCRICGDGGPGLLFDRIPLDPLAAYCHCQWRPIGSRHSSISSLIRESAPATPDRVTA